MRLSSWHHAHNGLDVSRCDIRGTAQSAFQLGGFLGQDVAFERMTTFNSTTRTHAKTFFRRAFGFHFRHNHLSFWTASNKNRIAGGNDTLLLGACFHLFGSTSEGATYNVPPG
jgi:hypothetical protein